MVRNFFKALRKQTRLGVGRVLLGVEVQFVALVHRPDQKSESTTSGLFLILQPSARAFPLDFLTVYRVGDKDQTSYFRAVFQFHRKLGDDRGQCRVLRQP